MGQVISQSDTTGNSKSPEVKMPSASKAKSLSWIWILLFFVYALFISFKTYEFFVAGSPYQTYYQFLIGFNLLFFLPYSLNVCSVTMNALSLFPFIFFLTRNFVLSPLFWKLFLLLRIILDLTGRSYEFLSIKSLFYQDLRSPLLAIGAMLAIILPSYIAHYLYAFKWEQDRQ
jgi:hypothetical protein